MRPFHILAALLLCAATASFADPAAKRSHDSQGAQLAAFKQAIRQLYDMKEKAWAAGDAQTIVAKFYSADAVSAGEADPVTMVGRAEFRKAYLRYVKDVTSVHIESVRTFVNGDAGWDWTNFYHTPKPDKAKDYPPSPVRILFLWSREGGKWSCKGEMFVNGKFDPPLEAKAGEK